MQRGDIRHRHPERRGRQRAPHLAGDPLGQLGVACEDAAEQARAEVAAGPIEVAVLLEREPGERDHRRDQLAPGLVELRRVADGEHAAERPAAAEGLQRDALRAADRLAGDERSARPLPRRSIDRASPTTSPSAGCSSPPSGASRSSDPAASIRPTHAPRRFESSARVAESPSGRSAASEMARWAASAQAWRAYASSARRSATSRAMAMNGTQGHLEQREPLPPARVDERVEGARRITSVPKPSAAMPASRRRRT